jgi:hypothetical protein
VPAPANSCWCCCCCWFGCMLLLLLLQELSLYRTPFCSCTSTHWRSFLTVSVACRVAALAGVVADENWCLMNSSTITAPRASSTASKQRC